MRIIAGKYKGHQLVSFKADHIRPTTDFVKENLFNIIAFQIEGSRVLDLFSGTGSLGLEALSRGASYVEFVDDHKKSIEILNKNLEKLKITSDFKIIKSDVLKYIKSLKVGFDIALIDPPFTEKMADQVLTEISQNADLKLKWICIESVRHETVHEVYGSYKMYRQKDYKDKFLNVYKNDNF